MFGHLLFVFSCCALTSSQSDRTPSSHSGTVFGGNIFLPEIIPLNVHPSLADNGSLIVTIDLLYSEDAVISWVAHGSGKTYVDTIYLHVNDTVPSALTLQLSIPGDLINNSDTFPPANVGIDKDNVNEVFRLDGRDFLVDFNEMYIKFQGASESAVLKISLDVGSARIEEDHVKKASVNDTHSNDLNFPELMELKEKVIVVTPGQRTLISINALFTENDRYSVRGLLFNSSSNMIFTTTWSTDYFLGQSDFQKISSDENADNFDDNVILVENFDDQESSNIRQILIDVPTDKGDISGVYTVTAHHEADPGDPGIILESSLQMDVVLLQEHQERGPIPSGILQFEGGDYSRFSCRSGVACLVSCHVYGAGVQSIQLMHKDAQSEFKVLPTEHQRYEPYESDIVVVVDTTNSTYSGTYICKADIGPLSISKEIDVFFI